MGKVSFFTICLIFIFLTFVSCSEKIDGDLNISKDQALEIAKDYNIYGKNVQIYLETYFYPINGKEYKKGKRKQYLWKVSKKCNHCAIIQIDATTGKIISVGKYNYQFNGS